jgi:hypothetical protein
VAVAWGARWNKAAAGRLGEERNLAVSSLPPPNVIRNFRQPALLPWNLTQTPAVNVLPGLARMRRKLNCAHL